MVRKLVTLMELLIVGLGLTAFSGSSRPAAQAGGTSPVVQVLLILGIIVLFVLIEWFLLRWLRGRSEAAEAGALQGFPLQDVEVVLTGRQAPPELIELADLVTEMREVKHPYQKGIVAQRGIEY